MTLHDFLVRVSTDPELLARFRRDPDGTIAEAGLSEPERHAVREGDLRRLWALLPGKSEAQFVHPPPLLNHPPPPPPPPPPEENHGPPLEEPVEVPPPPPPPEENHGPGEPPPQEEPGEPPPEEQAGEPSPEEELQKPSEPGRLWDAGGLTVVGSGIRGGLQTTPEARVCIVQASKVLYLVGDPVSEAWVRTLSPAAESLQVFYQRGKRRLEIYDAMVERILFCLRENGDVCAVFYGHPGVFSYPAREAIRRARLEGHEARMLPGISAEDNLLADLGIDPGTTGLQSYEVTRFLTYTYRFDTSAGLILWQVGVLGETRWDPPHKAVTGRLKALADHLIDHYGPGHEVVLYRAPELPFGQPMIERLPLSELPRAQLAAVSTLYIPPKGRPGFDRDMVKKLAMVW